MKERRPINAWFVIIFVQDQLDAHINVVHERKSHINAHFVNTALEQKVTWYNSRRIQ